jgi:chromosome segregation ATPase
VELAGLKRQLKERDTQIKELEEELARVKQEMTKIEAGSYGDALSDLRSKFEKLRAVNKRLQDQLAAVGDQRVLAETIEQIKNELALAAQKIEERERELVQAEDTIEKLREQLESAQNDDTAALLSKKELHIQTLTRTIQENETNMANLKGQMERLTQELTTIKSTNSEDGLQLLRREVVDLQTQNSLLQSKKNELEADLAKSQNLIAQLKQGDLQNAVQKLNDELIIIKTNEKKLMLQIKGLNQELHEKEAELDRYKMRGQTGVDAGRIAQEASNAELADQQRLIETLQRRVNEMKLEIQESNTRHTSRRIRELKALLDELKKRAREQQLEVSALRAQTTMMY